MSIDPFIDPNIIRIDLHARQCRVIGHNIVQVRVNDSAFLQLIDSVKLNDLVLIQAEHGIALCQLKMFDLKKRLINVLIMDAKSYDMDVMFQN